MNTKKFGLVVCVAIFMFFGVGCANFGLFRPGEKFNPNSYLPEDGKIAEITPTATKSFGVKGAQKAVIFQDIDNDNVEEVVVFYTLPHNLSEGPSANVIILKEKNGDFKKLWEDKKPAAISINPLSGVRDINSDGKPEIVAARWVGASFGGYLDIFQWNGEKIVKLNGGWNVKNDIRAIELEDMEEDGIAEIIIRHRFSYPDVYKWEKDKYSLYEEGGAYPTYQ